MEMTELLHSARRVAAPAFLLGLALLLTSCAKKAQPTAETSSQTQPASAAKASSAAEPIPELHPEPGGEETKVLMHNVILNERPGFQLHVRWLRGEMRPTQPKGIPSFDDPKSFVLDITDGVIASSLPEIASVLNGGVLTGTPLSKVSLAAQGQQLKLNGTVHKGIPLPIEMISDVSAAPDGRIHLHVVKLRVLKLPVTGLMQSLHISAGDVIGANVKNPNVQVSGDEIYLNPEGLLPAPEIHGKLTAVHIGHKTGDLISVFGQARPEVIKVKEWRNFIRLRGGTVNFGKLTMQQTDLFLIDASQDEWFSFDLTRYEEQLVNGRIQMTPQAGLHIFMPDIEKIPRTEANRRINVEWLKNRNIPPPPGVAD